MGIKEKVRPIVGILLIAITLSGCAVGMALHGKREPELSDLKVGMDITEAHFILRDYTPAVTTAPDGDRIEEYKIELGNAPSGGRALGHLAMDVLTFGAWEIVGTPMEGFTSGTMMLRITYRDDKISKIQAGKGKEGL
ncbi:MAG: hypothetical protein JW994_07580 [Candidatus Omnitrophica bacterium]|nr:hypothetical protein [Candidatus Omnitrophota bacterium]